MNVSKVKVLRIRHTSGIWEVRSKKSIPDAILIPRSLSPPYEYIEGGDFRDTLSKARNPLKGLLEIAYTQAKP